MLPSLPAQLSSVPTKSSSDSETKMLSVSASTQPGTPFTDSMRICVSTSGARFCTGPLPTKPGAGSPESTDQLNWVSPKPVISTVLPKQMVVSGMPKNAPGLIVTVNWSCALLGFTQASSIMSTVIRLLPTMASVATTQKRPVTGLLPVVVKSPVGNTVPKSVVMVTVRKMLVLLPTTLTHTESPTQAVTSSTAAREPFSTS